MSWCIFVRYRSLDLLRQYLIANEAEVNSKLDVSTKWTDQRLKISVFLIHAVLKLYFNSGTPYLSGTSTHTKCAEYPTGIIAFVFHFEHKIFKSESVPVVKSILGKTRHTVIWLLKNVTVLWALYSWKIVCPRYHHPQHSTFIIALSILNTGEHTD